MTNHVITINSFNSNEKTFSVTNSIEVERGDTVQLYVENDGTWPFGEGSQDCTLTFNLTPTDVDPFDGNPMGSTTVAVSNGGTTNIGTVAQSVTAVVTDTYDIAIGDYSVDPDIIVDPPQ